MEKIKVLIVDTENGFRVEEIENTLDDFYKIIDCRCIDIATRKIGNNKKYYDIICDDEGLFVDEPKVSAINQNFERMLVGNLIITNYDKEGNTISLTDDDIDYLSTYCRTFTHKFTRKPVHILMNVEY